MPPAAELVETEAEQSPAAPRNTTYWFRQVFFPVFAIVTLPPFLVLIWSPHVTLCWSLTALYRSLSRDGGLTGIKQICAPVLFASAAAWKIVGVFAGVELALMRLLPGKRFEGPITPKGNVPVYKANGVAAF